MEISWNIHRIAIEATGGLAKLVQFGENSKKLTVSILVLESPKHDFNAHTTISEHRVMHMWCRCYIGSNSLPERSI
jgi:hypothetical protein